jgi:chemotaxis regulatin CheY-phosphate phosphatase CheZ
MHSRDITEILHKINEMRAVFVLGQRAVPFLEEVFFFLKEISPLIDEINSSIRESTATMPRATSQLQSVSEATELATTEIMDLVDAVLGQLTPMKGRLDATSSGLQRVEESASDVAAAVEAVLAEAGLEMPASLQSAIAGHGDAIEAARLEVDEDAAVIEDIRARVNRIMISLQVQDITAQQIASVNHLIESVRSRMTELVERLGTNSPLPAEEIWPIYTNTHFDPNARYETGGDRQSLVDRVMAEGENSTDHPKEVVKADGAEAPAAEPRFPESARPKPAPEPATKPLDAGPASQAEIDALFSNGFAS